jgi:hypothetical protein
MTGSTFTRSQSCAGLLAVAAIAAAIMALSATVAMMCAPALLLVAFLLAGRFPGERLIERLRTGLPRISLSRPASAPLPRLALVLRPTGSRFAYALSMRPPPATA